MSFFRLPSQLNEQPQWWNWGSHQSNTILLPGDALLSETLRLPPGILRPGQVKQWLKASPDICQWRPDKDKLLKIRCEGEYCYYWAVERQLWQYWLVLIRQHARGCRWLPDWMLLPPPDKGRPFALETDDSILFRYENGSGGALPGALKHLIEPLAPRWLVRPGKELNGNDYRISPVFLQQQLKRATGRCVGVGGLPSGSSLLPSLLAVSAAFFIWQFANAAWLVSTRVPYQAQERPATLPSPETPDLSLSSSLEWLETVQVAGPVMLRQLQWSSHSLSIEASSPVSCQILARRLEHISPAPSYQQHGDICELNLKKGNT